VIIERSREADAFLTTVDATPPDTVSACDGWTTHEVTAHVLGIAVEVIRHLDPFLQGEPVPETRTFEEREAPLRELDDRTLLSRLDGEEHRMRVMVADVLERAPEAVIPWTGRKMAVAKFIPHLRNEHALHRWDIAGDDDVSQALLGSMELMEHSVGELGRILLVAGGKRDPEPESEFHVILGVLDQPDLHVRVEHGAAALGWTDESGTTARLDLDAGARHLFIWGRRPDHRGRVRSRVEQPDLARLQTLLAGY
jgi:hypothetical protein